MRGINAVAVLGLLVSACGVPASDADAFSFDPDVDPPSVCQDFIAATADLTGGADYEDYVSTLNAAAVPVYEYLVSADHDLPGQVLASWETLSYGRPSNDDLEAVHFVGGLLVPEMGPACEELGRNVGHVPPTAENASDPPAVELLLLYEEVSIHHACDVFIQTQFGWSDARSSGAEIGLAIADLADRLIADLESQGVTAAMEDLAAYAEKYRTLPIVQAHEEAEAHLAAASRKLVDHSVVCAHLSTWDDPAGPVSADLDYHRFRWDSLGFDDYTARVGISDPEDVRGGQQLLVVVRAGTLAEVYDIRTAELIDPPSGVPLTVTAMFDAVTRADAEHVSFHPVLGYPRGLQQVSLRDLSEGLDFDRSILGSIADASARVEVVDEFTPDLSCGAARVPGGVPIPSTRPLDDDARQALDALNAAGEEGSRFIANYDYGIFERTEKTLVLLGEDGQGNLSDVQFVRENGQWKVVSWGTCHWGSTGYRQMPWFLDPEVVFEADSDEIHLIVGDECGTHSRFGNEFIVVAETSVTTVDLEVWRADDPPRSPDGPQLIQGCEASKVVKLTVALGESVGDRALTGATDPVDWPEDF